MKNFALVGAAGYIAPRHMGAIRDTGHRIVAALDPSDSVGIIDSYFPDAHFFTEFERFDRHIDKLRRTGSEARVDHIAICSPNYLHDSHMRFALRAGADAICEKPLVLNPWNLDALAEVERDTGHSIRTILQLRLHPAIMELKARMDAAPADTKHEVDLTYVTSRGRWYHQSWKGDERKAGGIATNIGVHFFDMLHFIFGSLQENIVHVSEDGRAGGYLEYARARVRWFLSLDINDVPAAEREKGYADISVHHRRRRGDRIFRRFHRPAYAQLRGDPRRSRLRAGRQPFRHRCRIRHSQRRATTPQGRTASGARCAGMTATVHSECHRG